MLTFYTPQRFPDVFRGYKKAKLAWNGLMLQKVFTFADILFYGDITIYRNVFPKSSHKDQFLEKSFRNWLKNLSFATFTVTLQITF